MKKVILAFAAFALSVGMMSAQDLATATSTYNSGAEALALGNKTDALEKFQQALSMAAALGEEGADVVTNCKNAIPNVMLSIGKELYNDKNFDAAIEQMNKAAEVAAEYGVAEVVDEVKEILPQVMLNRSMDKANAAFKAKDMAGAVAGYKEVLAADSTNAVAALRLGQLLSGSDIEAAEKYFGIAAANGQKANADKALGGAYLKKAAAMLKGQKYTDAVKFAVKANEIAKNAQALLVAGQASQKLGKNGDAVKYFEDYLEASPTAKNANAIAFTVGALYQQMNNKAKAIEFYQKVVSDPQFGGQAKQLIDSLKK